MRILVKMMRSYGYALSPLKILPRGDSSGLMIRAIADEDYEEKSDIIFKRKHDIYDKLKELGFKSAGEKNKPTSGESQCTFHQGELFVVVNTIPSEQFDFTISIKSIPFKTVSKAKARISYRLPRLKRGSLGTGEYSVNVGDKQIGRIWCMDKNNHDPNKQNWCAELYEGFDHLAYPDSDKEDIDRKEAHVVYDKDRDSTKLFSGESFTVQQSRHWITSVFDRNMWESGIVPY